MVDPTENPTTAGERALRPAGLVPLPLGAIRPTGWLADTLRRQVDGMAGHLDEHWPSIRDSSWIGGTEDGWERGPYWLDAVIPLAALTRDGMLAGKVRRWIDAVLERQDPTGWMGPYHGDLEGTADGSIDVDVWPRMPLLKALLQFRSATQDPRIVPAAHRLALRIGEVLPEHPLRSWAYYRAADLIACLHELYGLTGDGRMLDVAEAARSQAYSWSRFAAEMPVMKVTKADIERWRVEEGVQLAHRTMISHGVNVAMGLKWMPVVSRTSHSGTDRADFRQMLETLETHHGQVSGLFSADEHLGGRHPSQGTETCTVVELMFSLETALETWGVDEATADRLERIAYNALPAASTADDSGHQYDQQANQVDCTVVDDPIYTDNGPESNTFGLEPNFGCCTANRHQGWPKFAARLWMRDPADGGLTAISYAPTTVVDDREDGVLTVEVDGRYPFGDEVGIRVSADRAVQRPLHLRIPGWATEATLTVGDAAASALEPGTVLTVDRTWGEAPVELVLRLPAPVAVRGTGPVSVESGPLLFVLPVAERWGTTLDRGWMTDQQVRPASRWSRGLVVDGLTGAGRTALTPGAPGSGPFSPGGAQVGVTARVRDVAGWDLEHGAAAEPPVRPSPEGSAEAVTLLPYGAARLRVTVLPAVLAE